MTPPLGFSMFTKRIYKKLEHLGVIVLIESKVPYAKSSAPPFSMLHFDRFDEQDGAITIALAHYYEKDGDLCADPDMQIRVIPEKRIAEALTYQQAVPFVYNEVYPEPGKVNLRLKKELNGFLEKWIDNLIAQGHRFKAGPNPTGQP